MTCFLPLVVSWCSAIGLTQDIPPEILRMMQEAGEMPPGVVISSGSVVAGGEDAAAAGPSPRLQALQQLKFDRRPSAILAAWSTPEEAPPSDEEETVDEEAAEGEGADAESADESEGGEAGEEEVADAGDAETEASDEEAGAEVEMTEEEAEAARQAAEAQAAAEKAAEEAAEAAAAAAKEQAKLQALVQWEMKRLQRRVSIGDWAFVAEYFSGLTEDESKAGYKQLLTSLLQSPPPPNRNMQQWAEKNAFAPEDVIGLSGAATAGLEDEQLNQLGTILAQAISQGHLLDECVSLFRMGLAGEDFALNRRQVARVLFGAGHPLEAGEFLPSVLKAKENDDRAGLNLLARHYVAKHADEDEIDHLERAWEATQLVLAEGEVHDAIKTESLTRAVELAPKLPEELGLAWLRESFTQRPERGMEVLAAIGRSVATGMQTAGRSAQERLRALKIQTTAAESLLQEAPETATTWASTLNLLASNWLKEAQHSQSYDQSTARGPRMERDFYGNLFYSSYNYNNNRRGGNFPTAITAGEMLDLTPSASWLALVHDAQRPKFSMVTAELLLKVGEEDLAFPHIEALAQTHPDLAEDLVSSFLRVWIDNHDPNAQQNRTNSYMFMYGFEQRANGIPLTRSKQERNLAELSEWVARLRALPLEELDERLLAEAFTAAHSRAEVYQLESFERVFGSLDAVEPDVLAQLVQTMRANLANVWRQPATQEDAKTRRRQKDLQAEVQRGYDVCVSLCNQGLSATPDHWPLQLVGACIAHDRNEYEQELKKSSSFSVTRRAALTQFQQAAEAYAEQLETMDANDKSSEVYERWFYAALGASDLGGIDQEKQLLQDQIPLIREAMESLPDDEAGDHFDRFANVLFTRMSSVNPAVKFRYVRAGLEIVGDNPRAEKAREVHEYYRDVVTEIDLVARVDGADRVGQEPFGMFVELRHTEAIEREAGGFSKYLTNQNNVQFAYNYGRPLEDYRDKFEGATRDALSEHFEVMSVTFNTPDVTSKPTAEEGWRTTPYAYVLLKARGPEIDVIPPLRLDLDFLDTSGYVVLPVESSPVPMDAAASVARPHSELAITQTLDERQAEEGKLVLEVKARAAGLVPDLEALLDLSPDEFVVDSVEDQGVSVAEFDAESADVQVVSERLWMVQLKGREDLAALPTSFSFGEPKDANAESEYLRYVDADLEEVTRIVSLEKDYGEVESPFKWWMAVVGVLVLGGFVLLVRGSMGGATKSEQTGLQVPADVTPFTVVGFLRAVEQRNALSKGQKDDLTGHIQQIERHYFGQDEASQPDLKGILSKWSRLAGR